MVAIQLLCAPPYTGLPQEKRLYEGRERRVSPGDVDRARESRGRVRERRGASRLVPPGPLLTHATQREREREEIPRMQRRESSPPSLTVGIRLFPAGMVPNPCRSRMRHFCLKNGCWRTVCSLLHCDDDALENSLAAGSTNIRTETCFTFHVYKYNRLGKPQHSTNHCLRRDKRNWSQDPPFPPPQEKAVPLKAQKERRHKNRQ